MDNDQRVPEPAIGWISMLTLASDAGMGTMAGEGAFENMRLANDDCRWAIEEKPSQKRIIHKSEIPQWQCDQGPMTKEPSA